MIQSFKPLLWRFFSNTSLSLYAIYGVASLMVGCASVDEKFPITPYALGQPSTLDCPTLEERLAFIQQKIPELYEELAETEPSLFSATGGVFPGSVSRVSSSGVVFGQIAYEKLQKNIILLKEEEEAIEAVQNVLCLSYKKQQENAP